MRFIRVVCLIFCFAFILGCGEKNMNDNDLIVQRVNNVERKENLITKKYSILSEAEYDGKSINEIDRSMKIECLRKVSFGYYSVFMDKNGGLLYLFFVDDGTTFIVDGVWYSDGKLKKSDFDLLKENESTIEQVREIDPYGYKMLSRDTGRLPCSTHYTTDGFVVEITYNSQLTVTNFYCHQSTEDDLNGMILPIDNP